MFRSIDFAPVCLSLEEVIELSDHTILVEAGDNSMLIVGYPYGNLDEQLGLAQFTLNFIINYIIF
jgi:hypothetical protein